MKHVSVRADPPRIQFPTTLETTPQVPPVNAFANHFTNICAMQTYISAQKEVNIPWTTEFNSLLPWRPLPKGLLLLDVFAFAYHSTNDQLPLSLLERCMINQNVSTYNQGRTTTELNSHGPARPQDLIG